MLITSIGIGSDWARLFLMLGRTGIDTDACRDEHALPSSIAKLNNFDKLYIKIIQNFLI